MIHQTFPEPNTAEWAQWKQDCQQATADLIAQERAWEATQQLVEQALAGQVSQALIDQLVAAQASQELIDRVRAGQATRRQITKALAGQAPKIKDLYKRMRHVLFSAFHGKCAYCECLFILDQTGDVEHFRPKGEVLDRDANPVVVKSGGADIPHPGYYWLAYDWRNLLPSCSKCNRMTKTSEGKWIGKGARFPVSGAFAGNPGDESQEQPLLIHPVLDDPEKYLAFDTATGVIYAKDNNDRGKACIEIFDLNREKLPETRRDVYDNLLACMHEAMNALSMGRLDLFKRHTQKMRSFKDGAEEYALAGRAAIEQEGTRLRLALQEFLLALDL